jgi:hypothetical protein
MRVFAAGSGVVVNSQHIVGDACSWAAIAKAERQTARPPSDANGP